LSFIYGKREYKGGVQSKKMEKTIHAKDSSNSNLLIESNAARKPMSPFIPSAELIAKLSNSLPHEKICSIKKTEKD